MFITEDIVHYVEATTSRRKDKAIHDIEKISHTIDNLQKRYPYRAAKGWFITLEEPTADQNTVALQPKYRGKVTAISYRQFKRRLIDADAYLDARLNYPFGSMEDPDEHNRTDIRDYVPLDLLDAEGRKWNASTVGNALMLGRRFGILGDYGAGKSTTLRHIFQQLTATYREDRSRKFPILLNLRDHHGQTVPAEALERHARNIGYETPTHLTRAWLAGDAILMLDGFDEMATAGWSVANKRLRAIRYQSMELIRSFIENTPENAGIVIAGRQRFFDNDKELRVALGIAVPNAFVNLSVTDFTEEQVTEFLKKRGWTHAIPRWLPSRPLLLGYLASRDLLKEVVSVDGTLAPAAGWHHLLSRVCEREARIEAGIDGETVRVLIERLATTARQKASGLGPLQQSEIMSVFEQVCGFAPDDRSTVLLQRLPGLGPNKEEDGSRDFIDQDFAEVAKAGDVIRFIENPFDTTSSCTGEWHTSLLELGRDVAAFVCRESSVAQRKITVAAETAVSRARNHALCNDIVVIGKELGPAYTDVGVAIQNIEIPFLEIGDDGDNMGQIEYFGCLIHRLEIGQQAREESSPKFHSCLFGTVEGRVSEADLPLGAFRSCEFEMFDDSVATGDAIMRLRLPAGVRVLLTVLKKLYQQSGSGRKESAFYRGIDPSLRHLVPPVLEILQRQQVAVRRSAGRQAVWLPMRSEGARIQALLSAPTATNDSLLDEAAAIR